MDQLPEAHRRKIDVFEEACYLLVRMSKEFNSIFDTVASSAREDPVILETVKVRRKALEQVQRRIVNLRFQLEWMRHGGHGEPSRAPTEYTMSNQALDGDSSRMGRPTSFALLEFLTHALEEVAESDLVEAREAVQAMKTARKLAGKPF